MADAHKRKRHPKYKTRYRIKNWHLYEEGLKARGDITLWFSTDVMDAWLPNPTGKPGRQRQYSELAIETILTLRLVFKLPLREVEGFVNSLFSMIGLSLRSPDHTTLSRRNRTLAPIIRGDLRRKGRLILWLIALVCRFMEKVFGAKRNTEITSAVVGENYILQWITRVYYYLVGLQMKIEKMLLRPVDFLKKFEVICGHLQLMAVMMSAEFMHQLESIRQKLRLLFRPV